MARKTDDKVTITARPADPFVVELRWDAHASANWSKADKATLGELAGYWRGDIVAPATDLEDNGPDGAEKIDTLANAEWAADLCREHFPGATAEVVRLSEARRRIGG